MKRFFAITLSLVMLFTALPLVSVAENSGSACNCEAPEVSDWWYYGSTDCTDPDQTITRAGYCIKCGGIYDETIPTQPFHKLYDLPMYDDEGKLIVDSQGKPNYLAPTCEDKGYIRKQCSTCSKIIEEPIDEKGHSYGELQVHVKCFTENDPRDEHGAVTNLTLGLSRRYCLNGCGSFVEERSVGHSVYATDEIPATCFGDGHTAYKYCTTCSTESYSEVIPQLSHIDEDGNGYCDLCVSKFREDSNVYCSCLCHSESTFVQLLMPLFRLIWQLLGIDNCHGECEAVHYEK